MIPFFIFNRVGKISKHVCGYPTNCHLHCASGKGLHEGVDLLSGRVTSHTGVAAAASGDIGASCPPISVLTYPRQAELTRMLLPRNSLASNTVIVLSSVLDLRFAGAWILV